MRKGLVCGLLWVVLSLLLNSAVFSYSYQSHKRHHTYYGPPNHISTGEKVIIVDPRGHFWAAYSSNGTLLKSGLASAGSDWCRDRHRPCHTKTGVFRIFSLGSAGCKSTIFPLPRGGAPMPYCMFFNKNQALHGSPSGEVVYGNISHGCVRMHISDAHWLRFNFANIGTKVIIRPY